ncbi:alpha beta fold family hydrolase [Liquorilactobacillus aquaticus DSM 21051]|uniref:Putative 2-succinyl-6-hydroxy-2,4-cyclohexadiene-1-carboxylate synthase n=1 Tax=Liquorilactobacillus aquaticus DSM 21051 TaxID=1423725 RepID=A0A0R2D045_9LACO|nr:2-succinyl-6-hydroxy-2,4-cyclohexadiene-1-carboxylate synthase [Liquorilactobacillus aquaticus]KRM96882.1 alpha beta fold family hydrolase [Liquorilactobacillus aquaticus DSM 21051]
MEITLDHENYYFTTSGSGQPQWLLLHGFMGSHHDFDSLIRRLHGKILLPDLLGHGKSRTNAPYERYYIDRQINDLTTLIKQQMKPPINLWGYSMGGRLALGLALKHPELIKHLVLESSTAGLKTSTERLKRRQHDQHLAKVLRQDRLPEFVSTWEELELFSSQKNLPLEQQALIHQQRMNQSSFSLANSLLGMGTGTMPNYWSQLHRLKLPIILLAGELDSKYTKISAQFAEVVPHGMRYIIPAAGHNVHLEQPVTAAEVVNRSANR